MPDVEKVAPVKKELTEEERCRRAYHRQYQAANRKKLNDQKREWYLRTGRAKRKAKREEMRKAAVRTMVASGTAKYRDDYQEVEGMHNEGGSW